MLWSNLAVDEMKTLLKIHLVIILCYEFIAWANVYNFEKKNKQCGSHN